MVVKPVFIVGCGRSGTTLLFDLLTQHPGLTRTTGYPDGEDHEGWVTHGGCVMAGIGNVSSSRYGRGINGFNACLSMTREDVTEELKKSMHGYYWREVLKEKKGTRVLNKCPHHANKIDYLLALFPDAKIVHIVRDCLPVAASWAAVMKSHPALRVYLPENEPLPCLWLFEESGNVPVSGRLARHPRFFPGGGESLFVEYWVKTNEGIEEQINGREESRHLVRYEDLTSNPQKELEKILTFAELTSFKFETAAVTSDTERRHSNLVTDQLRTSVKTLASACRARYGYEGGSLESEGKKNE